MCSTGTVPVRPNSRRTKRRGAARCAAADSRYAFWTSSGGGREIWEGLGWVGVGFQGLGFRDGLVMERAGDSGDALGRVYAGVEGVGCRRRGSLRLVSGGGGGGGGGGLGGRCHKVVTWRSLSK